MSATEDSTNTAPTESEKQDPDTGSAAVRRGGLFVGGLIVISLLWYLLADRLAPFTDQARIQAYVVGVAPQVSGEVREIRVANNQRVKAGEALFRLDAAQYELALAKARSDLENTRRQVEAAARDGIAQQRHGPHRVRRVLGVQQLGCLFQRSAHAPPIA